ncbi:MAG TPA: hypothetical protein VLS45_07560 [Methylomicrobium sp.]|nr:hypothetical protein [Methylomicrobium sp.]
MSILMDNVAKLVRIPMIQGPLNRTPDFDHPQVLYEGPCSVQPFLGIEDEIDRDTTVSQCRLISDEPGFLAATARDYIEYDGELWKIDGRPFVWKLSVPHHVELNMRLVEG